MLITLYREHGGIHAKILGYFADIETYDLCYPPIEAALEEGYFTTSSEDEHRHLEDVALQPGNIEIFFEDKLVAIFEDKETYRLCLPTLEQKV